MANWADSSPNNSSSYATVLQLLRDRDKDAAMLFQSAPTNPFQYMIRFNRSTKIFEQYSGSVWESSPMTLAIAGGGTGAVTASAARTSLGLGTMATQNGNAVSITGGSISGLSTLGVSGAITAGSLAATGAVSGSTISGDGAGLTSLAANQLTTGTIPIGRIGTGTPTSGKFFRGDNSWQLFSTMFSGTPNGSKFLRDDLSWQTVTIPTQYVQAWGSVNNAGSASLVAGLNIASVNRTSAGKVTITFTSALADGNYAVLALAAAGTPPQAVCRAVSRTASSFALWTEDNTHAFVDYNFMFLVVR